MTVADPLDDDPRQPGHGRRQERVQERLRRLAVGAERRAGVEAEPAEPQDAGADHHERHRVRRVALLGPPLALADHQDRSERGDAGVDVDRGAAGEVERAALAEPTAVDPLEDGNVDEDRPHRHEHRPGRELHAVGDGARDERWRDRGEHPEEGQRRDRPACIVTEDPDALEEQVVEPADEVVVERRGSEGEADDRPQDGDDQHAVEVHHQHVEDVAALVHAAVEERQTRRHEQHQRR